MLTELNSENFEEKTANGVKLVEFYTQWCGYCKKQQPELNLMDKIWIGKIDAEANSNIAGKFNIKSYPTFLIINNGAEVERFSGFRTKEDLMSRIMAHL